MFVPIIGWIILLGYGVRVTNRVMRRRKPLPTWDQYGQDFGRGLYITMALLLYASPVLAFGMLAGLAGWLGGSEVVLLLTCCLSVLLLTYGVVANTMLSSALAWFAKSGDFIEFFNIPDRILDLSENINRLLGFWLNSVLMLLLFAVPFGVSVVIIALLFSAPLVGLCLFIILIFPVGAAFATLTISSFHLTGQWGRVLLAKRG